MWKTDINGEGWFTMRPCSEDGKTQAGRQAGRQAIDRNHKIRAQRLIWLCCCCCWWNDACGFSVSVYIMQTCTKLRHFTCTNSVSTGWTSVTGYEHSSMAKNPRNIVMFVLMFHNFFTALQLCIRGLAMSVCPSVRLSIKRVNCNKTKEISVHILIPRERSMHLPCEAKKLHCFIFAMSLSNLSLLR